MVRAWISLGASLLLAGCGTPENGGFLPGDADCSAPSTDPSRYECRLLQLVNQQRAQGATCGGQAMPAVAPLRMQPVLHQIARAHATDMAQRNYFSHDTPEGRSPFDRMRAAGYTYSTAGENIAAGMPTPEATMQQWMQSTGHCQNIMRGVYLDFGGGYAESASNPYRYLWVQDFGAP
jgi:uncharacterized protein YkwD